MKIAAIIAEYNPFHLGHEHLICQARKLGYDKIIAVMSGNFVQRGDCAIMDKRARTKAALLSGVDLVIELPLPYATASAQRFAYGAAEIIKGCGCVDALVFGSECGDTEMIKNAAKIISSDLSERLKPHLNKGMTFAAAREMAVAEIDPMAAKILKNPNDTLATEYVAAISESEIEPIAIKRVGADHDGEEKDGFSSASQIRQMLISGDQAALRFMPKDAAKIISDEIAAENVPACLKSAEIAMMSAFRQIDEESLKSVPDVTEGLENRILAAIRQSTSIDDLAERIKSKRYTMARIRRILLAAYLGIKKEEVFSPVPYIRILGANANGREILSVMKKTANLPIITRTKDANTLDKRGKNMFSLEGRATDLYWLMTPKMQPCGKDMTDSVIMID